MIFRKWAQFLPPFIEVIPIEIPGRGGRMREQPFTSMAPLVEALEAAISGHLEKPFAFFGHSMGATISFELTHRLRSRAVQPVQLFFSGRMAPQIVDQDPPTFNLPHDHFVEELRRLEGTPEDVLANRELLELLIPILRADFELIQTYRYVPRPPLACPVTVLGGIGDKDIPRADLEAWREHAGDRFSLHMFPGNHFFLHQCETQVLQTIAKALADWGLGTQ